MNCLLLCNYSLDYNHCQSEIILAEERNKVKSELSLKDSQIKLLNVGVKTSNRKNQELEESVSQLLERASRKEETVAEEQRLAEAQTQSQVPKSCQATHISESFARAASVYKEQTGLSPDQWKDLVKKLTPVHHNLEADFKKLQAHLQELKAEQASNESALREAQTEAWTKTHLNEEVSRALELSKQMHKEANDCAVISAKKLEGLETRFEVSRKVTERMLADAWQANASKDERIRILDATLMPDGLTQELHDKQIKLHEVEIQLVATQRLVEALQNQLTDAKAELARIEIENKKLECRLGEAKMRLDHDHEDEERLRAELERANADVEEFRASSNGWQRIAVSNLDEYAPEVTMQVKEATLQTLQDKIAEAAGKIQAMAEYNSALEVDADDLRYELSINERRLETDESIKIGFYEQHWNTVQEIFEENKAKTAMIKGFEARFSEELAKEPLAAAEVSAETFEDCVGPEFIDRTNALYRVMDEAREARGEYDLRRSDLDREKIKAIYGHGPAGFKPRPDREMPEGYPERKAAREIANLKWQVRDLKARLWQMQRKAEGDHVEGRALEMEEEAEEAEREWMTVEEEAKGEEEVEVEGIPIF